MKVTLALALFGTVGAFASGKPLRTPFRLYHPKPSSHALSFQPLRPSHPFHSTSCCKSTSAGASFLQPCSVAWLVATTLRGGQVSDDTLAAEAFDWCAQLGAPATLVAGAVLATLSQTRNELIPHKNDRTWIRVAKKGCRTLLLSSFALEVFCIFVTTVTGTMLLSHGDSPAGAHAGIHYHSPMGFLSHNHEFEYLTSRVTFLQGLLNWLAAVALEVFIPKLGEGVAARKMNLFISSSLISMIIMIIKLYNDHMTFYHNYGEMLWRYLKVTWLRYFWNWPMRPLSVVAIPWIFLSLVLGWQAFSSPPDLDLEQQGE